MFSKPLLAAAVTFPIVLGAVTLIGSAYVRPGDVQASNPQQKRDEEEGSMKSAPHISRAHHVALATALVADAAEPRGSFSIPESIRLEHEAIHAELVRATKGPGRVGSAARSLAAVLHPHFVREEQIALPPLGLLAALARGENTSSMQRILPMTDSLRAELPRMLQEHAAIREATARLAEAAKAAGNTRVARLASDLALHARTEEEVLYPAAVLVGEVLRARAASASR